MLRIAAERTQGVPGEPQRFILPVKLGDFTTAASTYAYLHYVLALFPWTRSISNGLFAHSPTARWNICAFGSSGSPS